jgi:molybdopterin converting factor small subunit
MISESPVVTVHIPPPLRSYVGGNEEVTASGDTVGEVLEAVSNEYPAFRAQVLSVEGNIVPGWAVYLGPSSVRNLQGLATPVAMEELVSIVATGGG